MHEFSVNAFCQAYHSAFLTEKKNNDVYLVAKLGWMHVFFYANAHMQLYF